MLRFVVLTAACILLAGCSGGAIGSRPLELQSHIDRPHDGRPPVRAIGYQLLYSFKGGTDGADPEAALFELDGTLYGTTASGGGSFLHCEGPCGTVFKITPGGVEHVLYRFKGGYSDGAIPTAPFIAVNGTLYSTTEGGGPFEAGSVFTMTPSGTVHVLYFFDSKFPDGVTPEDALFDLGGTLYGTTTFGGVHDNCGTSFAACGTVFKITTGGTETVMHSFDNNFEDGQYPQGALVAVNGTLYGTTTYGGTTSDGTGTVFSITPERVEHVLLSFSGGSGEIPVAGLINVGGTLYGTTSQGGASGNGVVFSVTTAGAEHVLHSFAGGADGADPSAGLLYVNGTLYGTTALGGTYNAGTIFAVSTSSGKESVLHSFGAGEDGIYPAAALIEFNGTLYGTTVLGGASNHGTVFALPL